MTQLLPCPFCGSARVAAGGGLFGTMRFAVCEQCGACGPKTLDASEVLIAWNRRAAAPEPERDGGPEWTCVECASRGPFTDVKYEAGDADVRCDECGSLNVRERAAEAFLAHVLAKDAAAPELLSVVERFVALIEDGFTMRDYDGCQHPQWGDIEEAAKSALALARRGTP